jgi:hypothetical protein
LAATNAVAIAATALPFSSVVAAASLKIKITNFYKNGIYSI